LPKVIIDFFIFLFLFRLGCLRTLPRLLLFNECVVDGRSRRTEYLFLLHLQEVLLRFWLDLINRLGLLLGILKWLRVVVLLVLCSRGRGKLGTITRQNLLALNMVSDAPFLCVVQILSPYVALRPMMCPICILFTLNFSLRHSMLPRLNLFWSKGPALFRICCLTCRLLTRGKFDVALR
jgi:hypothetical protein